MTEKDMLDYARIREKYWPVEAAVEMGRPNLVRARLKLVGDDLLAVLTRREMSGTTLLHIAVGANDLPVVRVLVEIGGAQVVNAIGVRSITPAYLAATNGMLDILRHLAGKGADLNAIDPDSGKSMLMAAIYEGHTDVALFLIDQGVECGEAVRNRMGWSAIGVAGNVEDVAVFLRLAEKGVLEVQQTTPLAYAIRRGSLALVEACLAHPVYRQPMLGDGYEGVIKECWFDDLHQMLLSWRSQTLIESALDAGAENGREPAARSRRQTGMSL